MATNYLQPGNVLQYTAGAAIASSAPVLVGDLLGVALTAAAASGDIISISIAGVFSIAKRTHASTAAMAQGTKVYWDATNSRLDNTDASGANKHVGYAFDTAASTAATVNVRLLG